MKTLNNCPVCRSNQWKNFMVCKDHLVSQESFTIVECSDCGFKFTNSRPNDEDLGKYYKSEDYISHSNTNRGIVSKIYHLVRARTLKQKEALLLENVSRGTVLDYGCGTGHFLGYCKSKNWEVVGIEPDAGARKIAHDNNINVFENIQAYLKQGVEKSFDAITLWHVLEHVTDLEETLTFFNSKLRSGGLLLVAVPNHRSYDAQIYKEHWAAYDVPKHLYHFEKKTMLLLVEKFGFKINAIKRMYYDSYYVSLLSERNRSGKTNYLMAFLNGFISNLKARKELNYSSLIYVFKKA